VDILLGFSVAVFIFLLLLFAAIRDYQIREVSNWVWLLGLFGLPLAVVRLGLTGLLPLYGLQALLTFILVIIGFRVGVLGGADGKVMLIISLVYPWIVLDLVWLLVAPVMVLIGGFFLVGFQSLWLLLRNILVWKRVSNGQANLEKPKRKTYWLTRNLSVLSKDDEYWKRVEVPLIVYFFTVFTVLLIVTSVLL
jgi:Flp pilus assembly protein protease CpaA